MPRMAEVDADALTLLLRTHREVCLRDDPAQWSVSDVEAVTEALAERDLTPRPPTRSPRPG
nr:hypothetical protein GCM10020093_074370 [Planobispora longispora]